MAISSGAAYAAVDKLVREVLATYDPHPDLEQVRAGTQAEQLCLLPAIAQIESQNHMPLHV